jgi:hypothetical protein
MDAPHAKQATPVGRVDVGTGLQIGATTAHCWTSGVLETTVERGSSEEAKPNEGRSRARAKPGSSSPNAARP